MEPLSKKSNIILKINFKWKINKFKNYYDNLKVTTIKTLEGHKEAINCLVHFNNDLLASSALDKSIRIWDLKTGNTIRY
jgi:WD40 repeat protein